MPLCSRRSQLTANLFPKTSYSFPNAHIPKTKLNKRRFKTLSDSEKHPKSEN